ncbi:MAG: hypothetical protein K6G51_03210 [Sphaerochaetaceae bacterium]|nr:hypothetical protein [Sphaerochaetaceae bacterium]
MPIYSYRCKACGKTMDISQSFSDDALTDCPECKAKNSLKKLFAPAAIVFKGSGFYSTDSAHSTGCNCSACKK